MELLQILGWIYLGVMLGSVFGVMALSLFIGPKIKQYTIDIDDLKEEIGRKSNQKNRQIF